MRVSGWGNAVMGGESKRRGTYDQRKAAAIDKAASMKKSPANSKASRHGLSLAMAIASVLGVGGVMRGR